jgi:heme A synthase
MLVVTTRLEPFLVATHLSTGILLFAMTLMTFLASIKLKYNNGGRWRII